MMNSEQTSPNKAEKKAKKKLYQLSKKNFKDYKTQPFVISLLRHLEERQDDNLPIDAMISFLINQHNNILFYDSTLKYVRKNSCLVSGSIKVILDETEQVYKQPADSTIPTCHKDFHAYLRDELSSDVENKDQLVLQSIAHYGILMLLAHKPTTKEHNATINNCIRGIIKIAGLSSFYEILNLTCENHELFYFDLYKENPSKNNYIKKNTFHITAILEYLKTTCSVESINVDNMKFFLLSIYTQNDLKKTISTATDPSYFSNGFLNKNVEFYREQKGETNNKLKDKTLLEIGLGFGGEKFSQEMMKENPDCLSEENSAGAMAGDIIDKYNEVSPTTKRVTSLDNQKKVSLVMPFDPQNPKPPKFILLRNTKAIFTGYLEEPEKERYDLLNNVLATYDENPDIFNKIYVQALEHAKQKGNEEHLKRLQTINTGAVFRKYLNAENNDTNLLASVLAEYDERLRIFERIYGIELDNARQNSNKRPSERLQVINIEATFKRYLNTEDDKYDLPPLLAAHDENDKLLEPIYQRELDNAKQNGNEKVFTILQVIAKKVGYPVPLFEKKQPEITNRRKHDNPTEEKQSKEKSSAPNTPPHSRSMRETFDLAKQKKRCHTHLGPYGSFTSSHPKESKWMSCDYTNLTQKTRPTLHRQSSGEILAKNRRNRSVGRRKTMSELHRHDSTQVEKQLLPQPLVKESSISDEISDRIAPKIGNKYYFYPTDITRKEAAALEKQTEIKLTFPEGENTTSASTIGKGNFGKLFLARNIKTGLFVVVKIITGATKIKSSLRESAILKTLSGIERYTYNLMPDRQRPTPEGKKHGVYLYLNAMGETCALVVHSKLSVEYLNLTNLIGTNSQSDLEKTLSALQWPTNGMSPIKPNEKLVTLITSNCIHSRGEKFYVLPILDFMTKRAISGDLSSEITALYRFMPFAAFGNGVDLYSTFNKLEDQTLKLKIITHLAIILLSSNDYMNSQDIYHFDNAPRNIVFTHEGNGYIIDVGCAKKLENNLGSNETGDSDYFSPERLRYHQNKDNGKDYMFDAGKSEAFVIGLILLEMILERYPLYNKQNQKEIAFSHKVRFWNDKYFEDQLALIPELRNPQDNSIFKLTKQLLNIIPEKRIRIKDALTTVRTLSSTFSSIEEQKETFKLLSQIKTKHDEEPCYCEEETPHIETTDTEYPPADITATTMAPDLTQIKAKIELGQKKMHSDAEKLEAFLAARKKTNETYEAEEGLYNNEDLTTARSFSP